MTSPPRDIYYEQRELTLIFKIRLTYVTVVYEINLNVRPFSFRTAGFISSDCVWHIYAFIVEAATKAVIYIFYVLHVTFVLSTDVESRVSYVHIVTSAYRWGVIVTFLSRSGTIHKYKTTHPLIESRSYRVYVLLCVRLNVYELIMYDRR